MEPVALALVEAAALADHQPFVEGLAADEHAVRVLVVVMAVAVAAAP